MEACLDSALSEHNVLKHKSHARANDFQYFENPIRRAVANGTFHLTSASLSLNAAATDTSLVRNLPISDVSQPDMSTVNTPPVADTFQPDVLTDDTPMPDAPMHVTTPSSKAWVIKPASAKSLSRTPSPSLSLDIHTRHVCYSKMS